MVNRTSVAACLVGVAALALVLAGCGPSATATASARPSRAPATPAVPGLTWTKLTDIPRPDDAFAEPSLPNAPSGPDTAGHPGHYAGQAIVDDVVSIDGRLVAVGYVGLRGIWTAVGWTSTGGDRWDLTTIDTTPASLADAVVADASGTLFAVGRSGPAPAVWTSSDGASWQRRMVPTISNGTEWERITAIRPTSVGLVAGGSAGPELGDRRARFWWSADGETWIAVADDPAFAGAEVADILEIDGRLVAIGRVGTGQRWTGSVAWVSDDGRHWQRTVDSSLAAGIASALAPGPDGGFVAVGSDLDEREALVWRSRDGSTWEAAPREASRLYNGEKIRMTDVIAVDHTLVAVGNYVGVQYGTAASWLSTDGLSWRRSRDDPALGQGEMLAVTAGGPGLVAVGSYGAPDNYIPTIWLTDAPKP